MTPRPLQPHGTWAAAKRHYRRNEDPCEPCAEAVRQRDRDRYHPVQHPPQECQLCGTMFTPGRAGARWCSQRCRDHAAYRRRTP